MPSLLNHHSLFPISMLVLLKNHLIMSLSSWTLSYSNIINISIMNAGKHLTNTPTIARSLSLSRRRRRSVGYIFFDVFNQNIVQNPIFKSIKFPAKEGETTQRCLSFWFSPFGRSEVTQLAVYQTTEGETGDADIGESAPPSSSKSDSSASGESGNKILLWSIQTRKFDTRRPQWYYGQATVEAATPHEVSVIRSHDIAIRNPRRWSWENIFMISAFSIRDHSNPGFSWMITLSVSSPQLSAGLIRQNFRSSSWSQWSHFHSSLPFILAPLLLSLFYVSWNKASVFIQSSCHHLHVLCCRIPYWRWRCWMLFVCLLSPLWANFTPPLDSDHHLHQISFEGEAIDGGFAVDDITFYDGQCQS